MHSKYFNFMMYVLTLKKRNYVLEPFKVLDTYSIDNKNNDMLFLKAPFWEDILSEKGFFTRIF